MRNLKRVLALALAVVMMIGMMVTASAATFADEATIDSKYTTAVQVTSDMGLFKGQPTGFAPKATLTRAEAAAIIYRVMTTDVTDAKKDLYNTKVFADVPVGEWDTGYIAYAANGGYIKGDGTNFYPDLTVTGTQFLAMMLRAMGYGQNGEFEGAGWKDMVLTKATDLGLVKNVTVNSLDIPATREIVAQLLFDALQAPTTFYTPALGYYLNNYASLGVTNFDLDSDSYADGWGRPGTKWTFSTGTKSTVIMKTAVYTTTTMVDECDIANAIGLTKEANIEAAYIDGEEYYTTADDITSNKYGTINPLAVTSKVGAQGRLTEVYDMGTVAGVKQLRLVEINTYLAQVSTIVPAYTDKGGHTIPAYTKLTVYVEDKNDDGYLVGTGVVFTTVTAYTANTSFAVNSWVLVTANPTYATANKIVTLDGTVGTVATVAAATVTPAGAVTAYTADIDNAVVGTTTVGSLYYNADKFVLNYDEASVIGGTWDAITDAYGNLIGLTASRSSYAVIEKIQWMHNANTYGGYVMADLVLANGEKVPGVTVAKINNIPVAEGTTAGAPSAAKVADQVAENPLYYKHIFTYSVNADGTYNIGTHAGTDKTSNNVKITNKGTFITDGNYVVSVNDETVFLVADKVIGGYGYTYTAYTGKNNVPSMEDADICYILKAGTSYASLVVVSEYNDASNTFVAYVPYAQSTSQVKIGATTYYVHQVYKVGETTPTTVYCTQAYLLDGDTNLEGIYTITVDNNGATAQLDANGGERYMSINYAGAAVSGSADNGYWDRVKLASDISNTLVGAGNNTYFVDDAKYFSIVLDANGALVAVSEINKSQIAVNDWVAVNYKNVTVNGVTTKQAAYVYTVDSITIPEGDGPTVPTSATVEFTLTIHHDGASYVVDAGSFKMTADTITVTLKNTSKNVEVSTGADNTYGYMVADSDLRVKTLNLTGYTVDPVDGTQTVTIKTTDYGTTKTVNFDLYV